MARLPVHERNRPRIQVSGRDRFINHVPAVPYGSFPFLIHIAGFHPAENIRIAPGFLMDKKRRKILFFPQEQRVPVNIRKPGFIRSNVQLVSACKMNCARKIKSGDFRTEHSVVSVFSFHRIAEHNNCQGVDAPFKIRPDVHGIRKPDFTVSFGRSRLRQLPVDIKFISCVRRNPDTGFVRIRLRKNLFSEIDEARAFLIRMYPLRRPYPVRFRFRHFFRPLEIFHLNNYSPECMK